MGENRSIEGENGVYSRGRSVEKVRQRGKERYTGCLKSNFLVLPRCNPREGKGNGV